MNSFIQKTALALSAAALFLAASFWVLPQMSVPDSSSPEAGFLRDMSTHHQQAIEMSFLVTERTDEPEVSALAFDIINTQANQRGRMQGWLDLWGLPQTTAAEPMQWMSDFELTDQEREWQDGFTPGARMAGMATREEMNELRQADGERAEQLYLELMLRHHEGGVIMARAITEKSDWREVTDLAQAMINGQNTEIDYMRELLDRYE